MVWNTCLLFFQWMLLLGYLHAYCLSKWLKFPLQVILQILLFLISILFLPILVQEEGAKIYDIPVLSLFWQLWIMAAIPFFTLASSAPLLQSWFRRTGHPTASDPYFLYAASNVGSLTALLIYPFWIEPYWGLQRQAKFWAYGFALLPIGWIICALFARKGTIQTKSTEHLEKRLETESVQQDSEVLGKPLPSSQELPTKEAERFVDTFLDNSLVVQKAKSEETIEKENATAVTPVSETKETIAGSLKFRSIGMQRTIWIILALIPSALLNSVTQLITTDITPIPLLWIIPLALYLLTFIIAFSRWVRIPIYAVNRLPALLLLAFTLITLLQASDPIEVVLSIHLGIFFFAALICHRLLAISRPEASQLTQYYLYMSFGGALGGIFSALLAPLIFRHLGLVEYPLLLLVTGLFRTDVPIWRSRRTIFIALLIVFLTFLIAHYSSSINFLLAPLEELANQFEIKPVMVHHALIFGIPLVSVYFLINRPVAFVIALAGLLLIGSQLAGPLGENLVRYRNTMGIIRVTVRNKDNVYQMVHGNTIHGLQRKGSNRPLGYYHPSGPIGYLFQQVINKKKGNQKIGAIGLGVGALAAYAKENQDWTFFELDEAVIQLAQQPEYFTYVRDQKARRFEILKGDARQLLKQSPDHSFDVLILDAFSSEAIPLHLLTQEAIHLYFRKLRSDGLLIAHISNRYFNLGPILAKLGETVSPPQKWWVSDDRSLLPEEREEGKSPSIWGIYLPADRKNFLVMSLNWAPIRTNENTPIWTDDHANLWSAWNSDLED